MHAGGIAVVGLWQFEVVEGVLYCMFIITDMVYVRYSFNAL